MRDMPPVISTPGGVLQTASYKMQTGTDNFGGNWTHAQEHLDKMAHGKGTIFENAEMKAVTQVFLDEKRKATAERLGLKYEPVQLDTLWSLNELNYRMPGLQDIMLSHNLQRRAIL